MEYVSYGTLRTFLQTHRVPLSSDPELQSLLTIASYHIALAMQHLRSKMVKTRQLRLDEEVSPVIICALENEVLLRTGLSVGLPADCPL